MSKPDRTVIAKSADGTERTLALLRVENGVAFVCAVSSYSSIRAGRRPPPLVGYPIEYVRWADTGRPLDESDTRHS